MKAKTKVLFFCKFPPPNTGQTVITQIYYNYLNSERTEKINTTVSLEKRNGIKFRILQGLWNVIIYFKLIGKLVFDRVDFVYIVLSSSWYGHTRDIVTLLILSLTSCKIRAHIHSGNFKEVKKYTLFNLIGKRLLKKVDKVIFLSSGLVNDADQYFQEGAIEIIPNAIRKELECNEQEIKAKLVRLHSQEKRAIRILYLSNMIKSKGYFDLAQSLKMLKERDIGFKACFVGGWQNSQQRKEFEQFLWKYKINERVEVTGPVYDTGKLKEYLLYADVFALPTYYPVEAQPVSIIEAMNAANVILSTNHASIPDYVEHEGNGFLVPKKDPEAIADKIEVLTGDPKLMKKMAERSREIYEQKFSTAVIKSHFLKLFNR